MRAASVAIWMVGGLEARCRCRRRDMEMEVRRRAVGAVI